MNSLTASICEDISDIPDNIADTQSIAVRSYLNYLSEKSLLSNEQVTKVKKKLPLKQPKPGNYIPSNDEVVKAFKQLKDKRFQTIFNSLPFQVQESLN